MRRASFSVLIVMGLCLMAFFCASVNAQYPGYGSSPFQESSYDFKGIPRYTMPRHSFIFTNNGQDDLRLVSARVSCQCTKVFIPEKRLFKPGERGEVVAQIDGVRFTGVRHVTVTVTFQRGANVFEIPLQVNGVILENVRLEPQNLNFQVDQADEKTTNDQQKIGVAAASRSKTVKVVYPGYNETVARVVSSNPYVDVKVGKPTRVQTGTQTELVVTLKPDAPAGYVNAVVQLWSNGVNGATPLAINVSGVVRAPLTVSPPTLTFFTPRDGERITKNVVITAQSDFTLKSVEADSKAITCRFPKTSARPTRVCVVPVSFDPDKLTNETENALVRIETTDGRKIALNAQISSGNIEIARQKKNGQNSKDKESSVASEDSENDAKVSVSGVKAKNEPNAEGNQEKPETSKITNARNAKTTRVTTRVSRQATLSATRPSQPYREQAIPRP